MPKPRAFGQYDSPPIDEYDALIRRGPNGLMIEWEGRKYSIVKFREKWWQFRVGHRVFLGGVPVATIHSQSVLFPGVVRGELAEGDTFSYPLIKWIDGRSVGDVIMGNERLHWSAADGRASAVVFTDEKERVVATAWHPWQDSLLSRKTTHLVQFSSNDIGPRMRLVLIVGVATDANMFVVNADS